MAIATDVLNNNNFSVSLLFNYKQFKVVDRKSKFRSVQIAASYSFLESDTYDPFI